MHKEHLSALYKDAMVWSELRVNSLMKEKDNCQSLEEQPRQLPQAPAIRKASILREKRLLEKATVKKQDQVVSKEQPLTMSLSGKNLRKTAGMDICQDKQGTKEEPETGRSEAKKSVRSFSGFMRTPAICPRIGVPTVVARSGRVDISSAFQAELQNLRTKSEIKQEESIWRQQMQLRIQA